MKIQSLQSLRLVFLLLIFLSHFSYGETSSLYGGGDCGVCFFFVLSGFVLSLGYGAQMMDNSFSYHRFLLRRFRKLYPLHLFCLLVFVIFSWRTITLESLFPLAANILLIQSWIPMSAYFFSGNGVAWFLSDMMFLYVVFPFVFWLANRWRWEIVVGMLAIFVIIYLLVVVQLEPEQVLPYLYVFPLTRLLDFFLGIVAARFYLWLKDKGCSQMWKHDAAWSAAELVVVGMLIVLFLIDPFIDECYGTMLLFGWWMPVLIVFFCLANGHNGLVTRMLHHPSVVKAGGYGFEFYMVHKMVIQATLILLMKMEVQPPYWIVLGLCLFVSVLVAKVLHFLLRPITRS